MHTPLPRWGQRRKNSQLRLLRIVGALTAPTSVALLCRWRSRPQHQKPTPRAHRLVRGPLASRDTRSVFMSLFLARFWDRTILHEEAMRHLGLALFLFALAISGAIAGSDLSSCLDPSTKLDAGGDVSDKELTAARQACARLQQSGLDAGTRLRVDHAASTLSDEQQHRQASHR